MNHYTSVRILLALMAAILLTITPSSDAFVPAPSRGSKSGFISSDGPYTIQSSPFQPRDTLETVPFHRQRHSVANVQTCSLFGLGVPELALIAVAAVILIGPQNLGEFVKDSGKVAGEFSKELKNVPEEFQKGMEEGEAEARSRSARNITPKGNDEASQ